MKNLSMDSRLQLKKGCRLQGETLLIPEGILKLKGIGVQIVESLDGRKTLEEIISELASRHPGTESGRIEREVKEFAERLMEKGAVEIS